MWYKSKEYYFGWYVGDYSEYHDFKDIVARIVVFNNAHLAGVTSLPPLEKSRSTQVDAACAGKTSLAIILNRGKAIRIYIVKSDEIILFYFLNVDKFP